MILEEIIRKQKLEIERLEKNNWRSLEIASNNMVKVQSLKAEKKELQDRIDKAIEYIKQQMNMYDNIEDERNDLLNILKGE